MIKWIGPILFGLIAGAGFLALTAKLYGPQSSLFCCQQQAVDPVGNAQMIRPDTNTAGTCLAGGGWPLMDNDNAPPVFVACLMPRTP
jgi:hypothetical protein